MAKLPFIDTHVHFYDLHRKDLVYSWLQPDFIHPLLGDIDGIKTLVYAASILALLTAGTLAWAVSHPCACGEVEAVVEVAE